MQTKNINNKAERVIGFVLVALAAASIGTLDASQYVMYGLAAIGGGYGIYLALVK